MSTEAQQPDKLVTESIKSFANNQGFTQIHSTIRTNTNGYNYMTFIDADNKAENVYFSKNSSSTVKAGQTVTKELLADLVVAHVKNAEGESRIKITRKSTTRIDLADMLG